MLRVLDKLLVAMLGLSMWAKWRNSDETLALLFLFCFFGVFFEAIYWAREYFNADRRLYRARQELKAALQYRRKRAQKAAGK